MNCKKTMFYVAVVCLMLITAGAQAQTPVRPTAPATTVNAGKGLAGTWQGTLVTRNGRSLRLVMKVAFSDGKWACVMYNLDQSEAAIKASAVTLNGDAVKIDAATLGGGFAGNLASDGQSMNGTWTQGALTLPLKLDRANAETAWALPTPQKQMPTDADPAFEVATIKPAAAGATQMGGVHVDRSNRFSTDAATLADLISVAYDLHLQQVVSNQSWMTEERYDVQGKPDIEGSPTVAQMRIMIRKLLAERFGLKLHEEQREISAFVLTVAKGGPKFSHSASETPLPGLSFRSGKGGIIFTMHNATMADLSSSLQKRVFDRPLVDQTGLTGQYDLTFTFMPDPTMFNGHPPATQPADPNGEEAPALPEALENQAGLKLDTKKTPVKVMVIDSAAKPTDN